MRPADRALLKSGSFDREAWAALWDRLPKTSKKTAAVFVLHLLHVHESGGDASISFDYVTSAEREESDPEPVDLPLVPTFPIPDCHEDQPGDVVTMEGRFHFGSR